MMRILFLGFLFVSQVVFGLFAEGKPEEKRSTIFLQPNTTQIFTELYQEYGLLNPPQKTFFEEALYLDQSMPPGKIPLQPANDVIFNHASDVLVQFHKRMHDLELYIDPSATKPFFYTGVGSKQLIVALVYAMVMSEPDKKFLFVEQAPYYSGHPNAVNGIFQYPNARFLSFHYPSEITIEPGTVLVEFVTSPNNPDGKFRRPLTNASIIIADFVFASSAFGSDGTGYLEKNIEWVSKARSEGKHVFSFNSASKQFGKTSARTGYMWFPLDDSYAVSIFNKFFGFISSSTVASSSSGLAQFLDLIKALLTLPDGGALLREDARKSLMVRHRLVEKEFLKRYPGSYVLSRPGSPTFFAQLYDPRIPIKMASDILREDFDVVLNNGEAMGESNAFIRLNISGYSEVLVEFLNRLAGEKKYKVADLFTASVTTCSKVFVVAEEKKKNVHVVRPGSCVINVDALKGPVEVQLMPLFDYLGTTNIIINKTDSSENPVDIVGQDVKFTLKKQGERTQVQWSQPLYLKGKWERVVN